ncbi:MAG: STAS domain-containing protein [Mycobacteriaceae bacterium]|nr:STAS domain-containing protein [Mycobacteriaceae bacterium]
MTIGSWRGLLDKADAATGPPGPLIVDCEGLTFMSCQAYLTLAEHAAGCQARGVRFWLVSGRAHTRRAVEAVGLASQLPLVSTVAAALSGVPASRRSASPAGAAE